jgi:FkbM family methyltransferase
METNLYRLLTDLDARLKRIERLCSSYSLTQGPTVVLIPAGFRIVVDPSSVDLGQWLIRDGTWEAQETNAFLSLLRPADVVLDVGANQGWYALNVAHHSKIHGFNDVVIYAIEPNEMLCRNLQISIYANGFQNRVHILNFGLSSEPGSLMLTTLKNMSGSSMTRPGRSEHLINQGYTQDAVVAVHSIDSCVVDGVFPMPTLVKADIEGWEGMMLIGGRRMLQDNTSLRMMIEWSDMMDNTAVTRGQIAQILSDYSFAPLVLRDGGAFELVSWDSTLHLGHTNLFISHTSKIADFFGVNPK